MKKLIFLLFALIPMFAFSQVSTTYDKYVSANANYATYTGKVTDTINGVATTDAIFFIEQSQKSWYVFSYMVSGDTLTGCAGNVTIQPMGSYDGVTYTNVGSAVTWTTTADYDANSTVNTYTEVNASHTVITTAYNEIATNEITTDQDTVAVPQITNTVAAQTTTVTLPGTDYRYIKIKLTGASSARVELQSVAIKVTPLVLL
jgi:hypothetical protein